jgi:tape measure domain-containing protein
MTTKVIRIVLNVSGAKRDAQDFDRSLRNVGATADGINSKLNTLSAAIGSVFAVGTLVKYADAWTIVGNKIRQSADSLETYAAIQARVFEIAQSGRSDIEGVALSFQRIDNAVKEFGFSQTDVLDVVDGLTKAFKANGQTAQEVSSVLIQLSQAFAKGRLDGDELRSVMEASLPVSKAIAKEFGVNVGQLKDLGEQGLLVSERVFKGVARELPQFQAAFDKANKTIADSFTVSTNSAKQMVGVFSEITGIGQAVSDTIIDLSKAMDELSLLMRSGAISEFGDLFYAQAMIAAVGFEEFSKQTGINQEQLSLSTKSWSAEITKFLQDAFLNAIPNISAVTKIITVELAAILDKGKAIGEAIFSFNGEEANRKYIREQFAIIDAAREQTITGILNQNEEEKKLSDKASERAKIKRLDYLAELELNKELLKEERKRTAITPVDPKKARADANAAKKETKDLNATKKRIGAGELAGDALFEKQFASSDLLLENLNSENDIIKRALTNRINLYQTYGAILNDTNAYYYEQEKARLELSISEQTFAEENRLREELAAISERQAEILQNKNITDTAQLDAVKLLDEQILAQKAMTEQRLTEIEAEGAAARERLAKAERDAKLKSVGDLGNALMNYGQGQSRKLFNIGKKLALAQAAVALPTAVMESFKNGGGYPWGLIPAAAMAATGLKNIQAINATTFEGGGGGGGIADVGSSGASSGASPQLPQAPEQVQSLSIVGNEEILKQLQELALNDEPISARVMLRYAAGITNAKRIGA